MSSRTSSAEPARLLRYSEVTLDLDHALQSRASQLRVTLEHFERRCTEPGMRIGAVYTADDLRGYAIRCEPADAQVGDVGRRFAVADRTMLGYASSVTTSPASMALGAEPPSSQMSAPLLHVPTWLSRLVEDLSWTAHRNPGVYGGQVDVLSVAALPNRPSADFMNLSTLGRKHKLWPERRGRPRQSDAETEVRLDLVEGTAWKWEREQSATLGGVRIGESIGTQFLELDGGVGLNYDHGEGTVGAFVGVTAASTGFSYVLGDTERGIGAGLDVTVGEAEAFVGLKKDGPIGAKIGGTLVSTEGTIGLNVAGWNVGLVGGIGAKFELGLELGSKNRVFLGPFTIGLNIGEALGS